MSLVPYSSRDSTDVVLRFNDAIVIRDPETQELILRSSTSSPAPNACPTCHRPFNNSSRSPERNPTPHHTTYPTTFISPEYFRLLQNTNGRSDNPPPSPIRRLVEPAFPSSPETVNNAEFVTSSPAPQVGHAIKKEAFSPGYFQRFFIEEGELGRGGKGVVLLVKHELDGVSLGQFACKRVPVGDDHTWLEKVLVEVQLLQRLSHPNLVSYQHVWLEDAHLSRFGPSVPCAFILQQYCNSGDLLHYIIGPGTAPKSVKEQLKAQMRRRSKGQLDVPVDLRASQRKLSFEEIYSFFKDIASGLAHLHASNYIHRDLKPSNCLLHKDGNEFKCLISDFGEVQPENVVRKSTGSTGTISYCAPEVLKQDQFGRYANFTAKSDIFSLGMILYFMCFGRLPYKSADSIQEEFEDMDTLRAEISAWSGFQDERRERPELPNQLYNFLKRLLSLNPADRPNANEILHAIQTEKGLDSPSTPRGRRSGSRTAPGGRIIQAVDSPMPPGTPINEVRRVRSAAYIEDASTSESSSPQPSPDTQLVIESTHARHNMAKLKPSIKTPLLMPPPATTLATFKHRITVYRHYAYEWITSNQQILALVSRFAIFLLKMITITKPCSPLMAKDILWYPLMIAAALELAMPSRVPWRAAVVLLIAHLTIVGLAVQWGGLCVNRNFHAQFQLDN